MIRDKGTKGQRDKGTKGPKGPKGPKGQKGLLDYKIIFICKNRPLKINRLAIETEFWDLSCLGCTFS